MTKRPLSAISPEAREVLRLQRAFAQGGLSRRQLLGGAGALGLGAFLAACGTGGGSTSSGSGGVRPTAAADKSDAEKVVNWANWTLYLDYDDKTKTYPSLEAFQKQTGIKATYAEDIEDNDSYYGKIQGQLKNGQDIGKDIITLTDWMAARIIRQGYVQKLDAANMPNVTKNLLPALKDVPFDKGRNYSVTWQSGFTGLAWNKAALKEATGKDKLETVTDLWDPKLKGRVEVLSEMRDTMQLIMLDAGVKTDAFTKDDFSNAIDVLSKQLSNGQIRQVKGNSYKEDLISGDAIAVMGWSGDITQLNAENGDKWQFAIPGKGGVLWSDNLMVPIGSPHRKNAEILINYYYQPQVAAEVAEYVNYVCPVVGAKEILAAKDPALAENTSIFPDDALLKNVHVFRSLTPEEETDFTAEFQKALGV
jgi:spermidine/putrescine transport system substrate-binding protein